MSRTPPPSDRRSVAVSVALYRMLLFAYPAAFRRRYGAAMVQAFRDTCRQASAGMGLAGVLALWLPTLADLVRTAWAERLLAIRHLSRSRVIRLCGLLTLVGGVLSLPLLLLWWWMLTVLTSPTFITARCQQSCTLSFENVSNLGALALLILRPLVALCLPFGFLGVLLLQQEPWVKRLAILALLGQVGVAGSSALGWDSYVMGLGQWLFQSTGTLQSPLASFVLNPHMVWLAELVLPVAVVLSGVLTLRTHRLEAWLLLLLGGTITLQSLWVVSVVVVFNPPMASIPVDVIDTGLALVESVLWASLGYALWVKKDELVVRTELPML